MKRLFTYCFLCLVFLFCWCQTDLVLAADDDRGVRSVVVVVEGMEGVERENVERILKVPDNLVEEGIVTEQWLERLKRQTPRRVRRALEPFGYYSPETTTTLERIGEGFYRLVVTVMAGEPVLVSDVTVEIRGPGAMEPSLAGVVDTFPLRKGDRLRHDLYDTVKGELQRKAVNLGYLDARYTEHSIKVSLADRSARIDLILDTGSQYRFGTVFFTGKPLYPEMFLRRYLEIKPGQIYSQEILARTQRNFAGADRFRIVTVTGRKESAEDYRIPVEITLHPSPPKRVRFGFGYGTDTGPRGLARYQDYNVRGLGHVLDMEVKASEVFQGLGVRYIVPGFRDIQSYTSFTVLGEREETRDKNVRYAQIEGAYTRTFAPGMLGTLFVKTQYEDSKAGDDVTKTFMVLPGIRFTRHRYDNLIRPSRGFRYDVEIRGTDRMLGSNVSFFQIVAGGEVLIPLPGRLSVLARARIGATTDYGSAEDLPVSVRFFAGGDNSVRGYRYQSLGPIDNSGKVAGGRHLFTGSIEVERAIGADWGVVAFYDAGNAFNNWSGVKLAQGVGLGVRYYTIVGPVRLDVARQIDVKNPGFRVHFSIGIGL